nr:MAG TPA: hypothetical protein [Caudoviricetes sp.]DAT99529.1 MAG TPA: hypothetical protein [Caudoviricetes sp.]
MICKISLIEYAVSISLFIVIGDEYSGAQQVFIL